MAKRSVGDAGAWALNVFSSVGLIYVNKLVMSVFHFQFATTLTGFHFGVTSLAGFAAIALGFVNAKEVPFSELFWFSLIANVSIVGMNMSLLLNSVGFYQIAKLSMVPVVCIMERLLHGKTYSRYVILSVITVVFGVAIVTVTDVTVNLRGFLAAVVAVLATALQQIYIGSLQKKHNVSSFELLSKTAPIQAASLLPLGPFVDLGLTGNWVFSYNLTFPALFFILLSCTLAIGCNVSQYLVIGRFSAVTFQVLGHIKTVCILLMGWLFFQDILSSKNVLGMLITITGMVLYGLADQNGKKEDPKVKAPSFSEEDIELLKSGADRQQQLQYKDIELGLTNDNKQ